MTVTHFREVCSTLGRFASVREKASQPTDRIIVQSTKGTLKLVAGTDDRTVIADCGPAQGDEAIAVVSARLLLSAGKSLKGKGSVWFEGDAKGVTLKADTGGEVRMPNVGTELPQLVRPPKVEMTSVAIPKDVWPKVSKAVDGIGAKRVDVWASGATILVRSMTDYHYLATRLSGGLDALGEEMDMWSVTQDFIASIRDFENGGELLYGSGRTVVRSWPFEAVTSNGQDVLPDPKPIDMTSHVEADTKVLLDLIAPLVPLDEHQRIIFDLKAGRWLVTSWDGKASVTVPFAVEGPPIRTAVRMDLLSKALRAWPAKTVRIGFGEGQPIALSNGDDWTILVAPVALA